MNFDCLSFFFFLFCMGIDLHQIGGNWICRPYLHTLICNSRPGECDRIDRGLEKRGNDEMVMRSGPCTS